jgi:hypothetical protein
MARYIIRASNNAGQIEFRERLTIDAALAKVTELRDAGFRRITLLNAETGVEIKEVEELVSPPPKDERADAADRPSKNERCGRRASAAALIYAHRSRMP